MSLSHRRHDISDKVWELLEPHLLGSSGKVGRPQKISNYQVFCATLYVLRTGISWRDLPRCYGNWHSVYLRFKKNSDRGVWWSILIKLQQDKKVTMNIVMADSTTIKFH